MTYAAFFTGNRVDVQHYVPVRSDKVENETLCGIPMSQLRNFIRHMHGDRCAQCERARWGS